MSTEQVQQYCNLSKEAKKLLKSSFKQFKLSARSHNKTLKVARTIADLAGSNILEIEHLAEALQYRRPEVV